MKWWFRLFRRQADDADLHVARRDLQEFRERLEFLERMVDDQQRERAAREQAQRQENGTTA